MRKKGFTLIELIVVMAIISILVLLGAPKYKSYTEEARITKLTVEAKELESASQQYYIKNNDWPRLSDDGYTADKVKEFSNKIYNSTGKIVELEPDGSYYDIDYSKLSNYISKPTKSENYILQNPVGSVYSLYDLTELAKGRLSKNEEIPVIIGAKSFVNTIGGGNWDRYNNVRQTKDGGYIAVGTTNSNNFDFEGLSVSGYDGLITKFDLNGNIEWTKVLGGPISGGWSDFFSDVIQVKDGGYIVVGQSNTPEITLLDSNYFHSIVVKYDSRGNQEWVKSYGTKGLKDAFSAITEISDGNYVIVGDKKVSDGVDALIVKIDSDGNLLFKKTVSFSYNTFYGNSICSTSDGGFIIGGGYNNSVSYPDAGVLKYSSDGTLEWSKSYIANTGTHINEVRQTNDGGYIIILNGLYLHNAPSKNNWDAYLIKLDKSGNQEWVKVYGGNGNDDFKALEVTKDGGYVAIFKNDSSNSDVGSVLGYYLIKFDNIGEIEWYKHLNGFGDVYITFKQTSDDGYVIVGSSYKQGFFKDIVNRGNTDAAIVKLDLFGNMVN